ncbi:ERF family protein [Enterococcus sp. 5H]|uniref:ERF family protein n=1 Tax=Enterococcus sp. 5H TaxID=1229490 RepID=UPI0023048A83|nr:ERF family protein [Enterococcus sp. 5H]MDA9472083.1 hypothetical protein [Enterococcus sp. 5H]
MSEAKLNVYQKLAKVRKKVPYLKKDQKSNQYSYVGSSGVLGALNEEINKVGLILKPEIINWHVNDNHEQRWMQDKVKKEPIPTDRITYFTELEMLMTWVNIDDPQDRVECRWYAQGVDIAGEKGVGKALTYGEKYFMLKFFNIATDDDDPDKFQKEQLKKTPITPRQIDMIYVLVDKVAQMANQESLTVINQAKATAKLSPNKEFEEYNGYEYGNLCTVLKDYINFYEAKEKKDREAAEKETEEK